MKGARASSRSLRGLLRLPVWLWLGAFFLVPFAITLKISLSEPATAMPPYRPVLDWQGGPEGWSGFLEALNFENYATLAADALYRDAALSSVAYALAATAILAVLATPLAYAVARSPQKRQPLLVALIVVPFWTSFLIRVYAWIAI
ncbi:ABC transporter permease, partial [uncultured Methylobacterium sp.]|uniref:ABC transporter permease n=1 Tax=uncultured Methylobacterium sp. TaxID=157278 RepID=UPI0035C9A083